MHSYRFPIIALLLTLFLPGALGQEKTYRPWFPQAILNESTGIVVATYVRTTQLPSKELLHRFQVKSVLKGQESKSILVIGAERSILTEKKLEKILFLKKTKHASFRVVIDFVDLPRRDAVNRVSFLESYLKLIKAAKGSWAIPMKKLCFDHLETSSSWVRRIIIRELFRLATIRADLFSSSDLFAVEKLQTRVASKNDKRTVARIRLAIEEGKALKWTRSRLVFPDAETRRAYLADLALFEKSKDVKKRLQFLKDTVETFRKASAPFFANLLSDSSTEVVKQAIFYLGELESGAGVGKLVTLAQSSSQMEVRQAAVLALGKIAATGVTASLVALLGVEELQEAVLRALIALDTPSSVQAVREFDDALRRDPKSSPELRVYLARILGKPFRKQLELEHRKRLTKYAR